MEDRNKIKEWIKTLKIGDQVAVKSDYFGKLSYTIRTVKKITPKGQIRLDDDSLYKNDSVKSGEHSQPSIVPYDQKVKNYRYKVKLCNELAKFKYSSLELEKLEQIYKIINEK